MNRLKELKGKWELSLVLFLIIEVLIFGMINPRFFKINVLMNSANDFVTVAIIALFMSLVIIVGGIDISMGSVVGLTSVVMGLLWQELGLNIWIALSIAIAVGALCGAFNGYLVAYIGVQAMVATLGTSFLYAGMSLVIIGFSGISAAEGITGFPDSFRALGHGKPFGIPSSLIIFSTLILIAYIILHKTTYGRRIFLTGINREAAEFSGIKTKLVILSTHVLVGVAAAISGMYITSYLSSSRADHGATLTLSVITAVVLGGTAITGGQGSIIGTALASVIIGLMTLGLQMSGLSTRYVGIGIGILLVVSVAIKSSLGEGNLFSNIKRKLQLGNG
ncbi:monosaccharide ABC transporter membrane protein, CUT2 family [Anaerovirgula multivorans]|uniref:Autoinducer 2 import system permease protein LsrD n=1 Tax=Anaerovirgula multivorans TaxID=312168 RepID=A0A239JXV0_9FIRM|nr:ABC transporter permease [Anaerovirgula multivorans]SNT10308.1 monosaccharide ABC transporter membrane protein, CUT2 family [Anaerovirgula multivorans]